MGVQFEQKDVGGTIYYEAPDRWDAASTPTVTLLTPSGAELVAAQNATAGPSTTVKTGTSVAVGATTVELTAVTSLVVGRQYTLGPNALGQSERVTVSGITTGTSASVELRHPVQYAHAAGGAFASTRLSVAVTAAQATPTYRSCLAKWTYKVSTVDRVDTTVWHISLWAPRLTLTEQDVLRREPRALDLLGSRQRLVELIEDVWTSDILEDLGQSCDPGALVSGDALRMATLYRVLAEMYLVSQDHEHADRLTGLYHAAWMRVLQQTPVDVDQTGTITDDDIVRPAWTGRLCRG